MISLTSWLLMISRMASTIWSSVRGSEVVVVSVEGLDDAGSSFDGVVESVVVLVASARAPASVVSLGSIFSTPFSCVSPFSPAAGSMD